jgi:hypothetical protein
MRNARLRIKGDAGARIGYFFQTELLRSPVVLDTRIRVSLTDRLTLDAGVFKTPFSREFLIFRGALPMAERSLVVDRLAPARQVGASLTLASAATSVSAGVFNGNGGRTFSNDGDGLMGVARVERVTGSSESGTVRLGVNAALSRDQDAPSVGVISSFSGDRFVAGADVEFVRGGAYALLEVIAARLDPAPAATESEYPWGFFAVGGGQIATDHRLMGRLEYFEPDHGQRDSELLAGAAYFYSLNAFATLVGDVRVPVDDSDRTEFIVRLQLALK